VKRTGKGKATSTSVASRAAAVLRSPRASKAVKSIAGSALAQREKTTEPVSPVSKFKAGKDL
jgi:hypothetical protein